MDSTPEALWQSGPPAPPEAVAALEAAYPGLPPAYLDFLRREDGSEGDLGVEPWWAILWPAAEVVESNHEYEVARWIPGFVGFGSSGGGELLAFDTRRTPWPVCMVPFIVMAAEDAIEIAPDFASLIPRFGVRSPDL